MTVFNKKYEGELPPYLNSDDRWDFWVKYSSTTEKFNELLCKINADDKIKDPIKDTVLDLLLKDIEDVGHTQVKYYWEIRKFAKKGLKYDVFDDGWGLPLVDFSKR
jgi:hypothetical protein